MATSNNRLNKAKQAKIKPVTVTNFVVYLMIAFCFSYSLLRYFENIFWQKIENNASQFYLFGYLTFYISLILCVIVYFVVRKIALPFLNRFIENFYFKVMLRVLTVLWYVVCVFFFMQAFAWQAFAGGVVVYNSCGKEFSDAFYQAVATKNDIFCSQLDKMEINKVSFYIPENKLCIAPSGAEISFANHGQDQSKRDCINSLIKFTGDQSFAK